MVPEALIISTFCGVFLLGLGLAMIIAASMAQDRHRYREPDHLKLVLRSVGASVATFGVLSVLVLMIGTAALIDFSPIVGILLVPMLLLSAAVGWAGVGAIRSAASLAHEMPDAQIYALDRRLTYLKSAGWCLMVLAFFTALLPFGVFLIGLIIGVAALSGGSLRAKQSTLLWLLAICVEKGLPLADEVEALAATFSGRFRSKAEGLAEELRNGKPLSDALHQIPGLVPQHALLAIEVGSKTGTLPQALRDAAQRQSSRLIAGNTGISSPSGLILYWSTLMCVIAAVVGFIAYYIMPKFKKIFEDFNLELPRITTLLIQSNDALVTYFFLFAPLVILPMAAICCLVVAQFYGWDSVPTGRLGRFFLRLDTPSILRSLSRAVSAQQPLDFGIDRIADRHRRAAVRKQLHGVFFAIKRGEDCWDAMHERRFISRHERAVLQSAQRAGNLPWALHQIAESIERRLGYRFGQLGEFLQPLLVLSVGLTVLFFCVGIFAPLLHMLRTLS